MYGSLLNSEEGRISDVPLPSGFPTAKFCVTLLLKHFELAKSTHILKNEHKEQLQSFPTAVMYCIITFWINVTEFLFGVSLIIGIQLRY